MDSKIGGGGLRPTVRDVMTVDVRTVPPETGFKQMVGLIEEAKVSALPVVSEDGRVLGIVSEADLLLKETVSGREERHRFESKASRLERSKGQGTTAGEIMSSPVITARPQMPVQQAALVMHEKRVRRLPVLDGDGRLVGIVSRSDLLRVYMRDDETLRRQIREDLILRSLWMDMDRITVEVSEGVVRLSGQVDRRSQINVLMHSVALLPSVVGVHDAGLNFDYDDVSHRPETPSWV